MEKIVSKDTKEERLHYFVIDGEKFFREVDIRADQKTELLKRIRDLKKKEFGIGKRDWCVQCLERVLDEVIKIIKESK